MYPNRKTIVNGHLIEEFYWAGKMVVYCDHRLQENKTYEQVIEENKGQ